MRARPIVITGATGTLGRAFARVCERRGLDYRLVSRQEMDIASRSSVTQALDGLRPWAVINTAGYVRVDDAEKDVERCHRENVVGPKVLAEACASHDASLVTFSSDLVFDGSRRDPYREGHAVSPLNVYGRTKAEAERWALELNPRALVVRTSAFFGPWDEHNFARSAMRSLRRGETIRAAEDMTVSPTYVPDLVSICLDLLIDGETGVMHLANQGSITWADWARWAAKTVKADPALVMGASYDELGWPAKRPRYSVLASERASLMPPLEEALERFIRSHEADSLTDIRAEETA